MQVPQPELELVGWEWAKTSAFYVTFLFAFSVKRVFLGFHRFLPRVCVQYELAQASHICHSEDVTVECAPSRSRDLSYSVIGIGELRLRSGIIKAAQAKIWKTCFIIERLGRIDSFKIFFKGGNVQIQNGYI